MSIVPLSDIPSKPAEFEKFVTCTAGKFHCSFVTCKARVTPLKTITAPRLELTTAVLSVRASEHVRRELKVEVLKEGF